MLRTIQLYEQLSYFESSSDFKKELDALYKDLLAIRQSLDQKVGVLVGQLGQQLMSDQLPSKSGFFNSIHRWWKNLFGGYKNKDNPYYLQNKIGALGRTDVEPPSVEEYRIINDLATSLMEAVGEKPQPVIVRILANWSAKLKSILNTHMDQMLQRVKDMQGRSASTSAIPATAPEKSDDKFQDRLDAEKAKNTERINRLKEKFKLGFKNKFEKMKSKFDAEIARVKADLDAKTKAGMASDDEVAKAQAEIASAEKRISNLKAKFKAAWQAKFPAEPSEKAGTDFHKARMPEMDPTSNPPIEDINKEAEKFGLTAKTPTTLGVFGRLDDKQKKFLVDLCKSGSKDCPASKKADDAELPRDGEAHAAMTPEEILSDKNLPYVRQILARHKDISIEHIKASLGGKASKDVESKVSRLTPEEKRVVLLVHKPWLDLDNNNRKTWNMRGRNGIAMKTNNKGRYPFRIPPVLRKNDPRIGILNRYYPDLYKILNSKGRIEHEGDNEMDIRERIKRVIRKGEENGEYNVEEPVKSSKKSGGKTTNMPDIDVGHEKKKAPFEKVRMPAHADDGHEKKKAPFEKVRMPAHADDERKAIEAWHERLAALPEAIRSSLEDLGEKDPEQANQVADAWESIDDKKTREAFKAFLKKGEFEDALRLADKKDTDDEIAGLFDSNFVPKGPNLTEVLLRRLKQQREGVAEPWKPAPKTIKEMIKSLKKQSQSLYEQS